MRQPIILTTRKPLFNCSGENGLKPAALGAYLRDGKRCMDERILQLSQLRCSLHRDQGAASKQTLWQLQLRGLQWDGPHLVGQFRFFRLESRRAEVARVREKVGVTDRTPKRHYLPATKPIGT
jgi:hypothetical protein